MQSIILLYLFSLSSSTSVASNLMYRIATPPESLGNLSLKLLLYRSRCCFVDLSFWFFQLFSSFDSASSPAPLTIIGIVLIKLIFISSFPKQCQPLSFFPQIWSLFFRAFTVTTVLKWAMSSNIAFLRVTQSQVLLQLPTFEWTSDLIPPKCS